VGKGTFCSHQPTIEVSEEAQLLRQFFLQVPRSLMDSARLDGMGELRILFTVFWPLAKAPLAMVGILTREAIDLPANVLARRTRPYAAVRIRSGIAEPMKAITKMPMPYMKYFICGIVNC